MDSTFQSDSYTSNNSTDEEREILSFVTPPSSFASLEPITQQATKATTCTASQSKTPSRRLRNETSEQRRARKAAARVKRDPDHARKPCDKCGTLCDVLVRCRPTNQSQWQLLCTGRCWTKVTGGMPDGNQAAKKAGYIYGGMWKNWKKEGVSAKMPASVKRRIRHNQIQEET